MPGLTPLRACARVNKQLIYYYFDSKVGLYEAVLGQLIARTE